MDKIKKFLKWFFHSYIWLGLVLLIADIVSKNIIVAHGEEIRNQGGIDLIPGFLRINYLINENVAFGMSLGSAIANRIVFSIVALLVVFAIIFYLIKKWDKTDRMYRAVFMMIIAGALGNVIDRLFYSAEYLNYYDASLGRYMQGVVDWIDFYGVWKFNFNIADSSIVVAAFMLIIYIIVLEIIDYAKKKKEKPKTEKKENHEKVLSASEKERMQLIEEDKED